MLKPVTVKPESQTPAAETESLVQDNMSQFQSKDLHLDEGGGC